MSRLEELRKKYPIVLSVGNKVREVLGNAAHYIADKVQRLFGKDNEKDNEKNKGSSSIISKDKSR